MLMMKYSLQFSILSAFESGYIAVRSNVSVCRMPVRIKTSIIFSSTTFGIGRIPNQEKFTKGTKRQFKQTEQTNIREENYHLPIEYGRVDCIS